MRVKLYPTQSVQILDTLSRIDPCLVVLRAIEATQVFIDQERANLDGALDPGGSPTGGLSLTNLDPPMILIGPKMILWGRAAAETFIEVQVIPMRIEVTTVARETKGPTTNVNTSKGKHGGSFPPGDWEYEIRRHF